MNGKAIRTALRKGEPVVATLIVSDSPHWPDMVCGLGLDLVFIDTEHIAMDRKALSSMCRAYADSGLAPMVRITSPDPILACMALDGGAQGIVAPYVETVDQVRGLVGALRYRPLKGQRLQLALDDPSTLEADLREYLDRRNANQFLIVNIESRPALENLDEILRVEELDGVLVGPHDLSCSLGVPEQYDHPEFLAAIDMIIARTRECGKGVGVHSISPLLRAEEAAWAAVGANLFVHSADIIAVAEKLGSDIQTLRESLSGGSSRVRSANINV